MNNPPSRSRIRLVVFNMIHLALLLLLAEAGLRLYDWGKGDGAHARNWWYWGFVQDPLLGYRARPNLTILLPGGKNRIDTNAQGFRDVDLPVRSGQRRLIICLGESSTWGTGSSSRMTTWPHQLQQILQKNDRRYVVFDAGMPGYTVVANLQLLNLRLLKYRPEAIVYMGFRNDVQFYMRSLEEKTDLNFYPRELAPLPATLINNLMMRSSLISTIVVQVGGLIQSYRQKHHEQPIPGPQLTSRGLETFRDQIALMKTLCDRHGIKLMWVDQPVYYPNSDASDAIRLARVVLHQELSKDRIPLLQAATVYDFKRFPLLDDVHYSDEDNHYLASILAPQILAELNPATEPQDAKSIPSKTQRRASLR